MNRTKNSWLKLPTICRGWVTALAFCWALGALAQESTTRDRLNITIKGLATYDDNVFQTGNEQNDYFYTVYGGIDAEFGTRHIRFGMTGDVRHHDLEEFDQQDDTAYDLKPRLIFGTGENLFTLSFFGQFIEEYKPLDETTITETVNHFDTGRVEFMIKPCDYAGMTVTAATTDAIYKDFGMLDYFRNEYTASLFVSFSDRATFGVKYLWADMDYDDKIRFDGQTERYTLYVDYSLTGKINAHIEGGLETHDYDLSEGLIADTLDDDAEEWFWNVSVAYSPTPKFDVKVGFTQNIVQSSSLTSNYYLESRPYLEMGFKATKKLTAGIRSYFSEVDENNGPDSRKSSVEAKLNYAICDWFEIEAGHEYTERDSESATGNFHRNVTTAGFVYRF